MGSHDGQPIPKLVSHLLHLLGHSTESRSLAMLILLEVQVRVGCTRKQQTSLLELQRSDKIPSLPLDNCLGVNTLDYSSKHLTSCSQQIAYKNFGC